VLELLRFRPVFPLVPRRAIRDTALDLGRGRVMPVKAGTRVVVGLVGAMFDPEASWAPDVYHPGRHREKWVREREDELLMFGLGERNCVAEHMVPDILVSALIGLLQMPGLRWPDRRLFEPRITYDGVIITRMPLAIDPLG
jgi:cytochrome P450